MLIIRRLSAWLLLLALCVLPALRPAASAEEASRWADKEASMETPVGELCINEVRLSGGDAVELRNLSDKPLMLSDYFLSDKNKNRLLLRLPEQLLEPQGLYVMTELTLSVKGERIWLSSGDETVLDYANIADVPPGGSYGRMEGEEGWFYFTTPSIGEANHDGWRRVSRAPAASLESGVYNDVSEPLSLTLAGEGTIYYTVDGSAPTLESPVASGPMAIDKTLVLRAMAVEDGALPSQVVTYNYFINENHTLPIACFCSDDLKAWNRHFTDSRQEGEFAGAAAFYQNGEEVFNLRCGLRLKGFTAVQSQMKKNFGLYFRGEYGDGDLKDCELFGNGVTEYSSLLLRAGQDHMYTLMRNEVSQELCLQASDSLPSQHNLYCILYMNGRYMGIFTLKENMNEHFFADWYGVSPESVTTLRERKVVAACSDLQEVFNLCTEADMSDEAQYARFCERFDIDNFIDYILLEGFCGNVDLQENVRYVYTPEYDERWRFAFFDLDCSFHNFYCGMRVIFEGYSKDNYDVTEMTASLLRNAGFRDRLLTRYAELLSGALSPENVMRVIDGFYAELLPEIDRDRSAVGISVPYWEKMVNGLRSFASDAYVYETLNVLQQDLNLSGEDMARYFPDWYN